MNNKIWIISAIVIILIVGTIIFSLTRETAAVQFKEKDSLIVLSNDNYEIAFSTENGGINYIKDKQKQNALSVGNRDGNLWWAFLDDNTFFNSTQADDFTFDWDKKESQLVLHYTGSLQVDVTVKFDETNRISMEANVVNHTGGTVVSFSLPYELNVVSEQVEDGLLPMLPGAKLRKEFFTESNSFDSQYPGVMFAPYLALRTNNGNIAIYDVNGDQTVPTMGIGFKSQIDSVGMTGIVHNYKTWMKNDAKWQSPTIVLQIGGDYPESITQFRQLTKIDENQSLDEKLGQEKDHYFTLPLYKMDISGLPGAFWGKLTTHYVDQLNYDGLLHLVGFQKGGHDENYPDFIPADPKWGTMDDMQAFVKDAQEKGHKVVPYTNFSWWGHSSPTLNNLPGSVRLEDIVVQRENGSIIKEEYYGHTGYVVDPNHPFFIERVAEEHEDLTNQVGFDGVFEDQWGARGVPFVYNNPESNNPSTAYLAGIRNYVDSIEHNFYTEDGFDVLIDNTVGFWGSNYLWDQLGYRVKTATYTDYYPMIGMLARDKVMLYQHNLARETMTNNQDMLRWNIALGYNLSADLYQGVTNPWVNVIGVFQKHVLANYVDELVQDFKQVTPSVTETKFESYTVTANWDIKNPYTLDTDTTLAPGGFHVTSEDGSIRAGVFTRLNGLDLDPGVHNLAIVRSESDIRVYQPHGSDTTVQLDIGEWKHAAAAAYSADGTKIADMPITESNGMVKIDFIAEIYDEKVAYIQLNASEEPSNVGDVPFKKEELKVNLALEKSIDSSTNTTDEYTAIQAVDGDPYTYWESIAKQFPQSITVDLGEVHTVNELVLKLPPLDAWGARDQQIKVLGSDDGQNFAKIIPLKAYTFDPNNDNIVTITLEDVETRYLRLTLLENTEWPAAQISELEVYGQ